MVCRDHEVVLRQAQLVFGWVIVECLWTGKPFRYSSCVGKSSTGLPGYGKGGAHLRVSGGK